MSTSINSNFSQPEHTDKEWQSIGILQSLLKDRVDRYVAQLTNKTVDLEQSVAILTAMLDSIGDGLVVADKEGNLLLINDAAEKLIGSDIPTNVEDPWSQSDYGLFYDDTVTLLRDEDKPMRKALEGKTVETIIFGRASKFPDGAWFRVHATPVCDKEGNIQGAIAIFHDITDERRSARQRETLSALITHDLKNHLLGESRLLKMIIDGQFGPLNEKQTELLSTIESDSLRKFQATKSLVQILRYDVRSEVLHFRDTDIAAVIKECLEEVSPAMKTGGLALDANIEKDLPLVSADGDSLLLLLSNLLGNAVKFTPKGGIVGIEAARKDDGISISVSDTGPGMSEADLKLLFIDVRQDISKHQSPDSTGLGLYLCAKIIKAHKGKISCASKLGGGTTFTIWLPVG